VSIDQSVVRIWILLCGYWIGLVDCRTINPTMNAIFDEEWSASWSGSSASVSYLLLGLSMFVRNRALYLIKLYSHSRLVSWHTIPFSVWQPKPKKRTKSCVACVFCRSADVVDSYRFVPVFMLLCLASNSYKHKQIRLLATREGS